ncbi:MAG: UvrD-helicase domain-containing protein [Candidatus Paceibacterota bacterium]
MSYLDELNESQKEAVLHTEGPLLILAGAGAGKTKTITHRILHLIHKGTAPEDILAVTFTNKAAKEMRERVFSLLEHDQTQDAPNGKNTPFVATFHSLGVHILRENARLLGVRRFFPIFDRSDSVRLVKRAEEERGIDPKQFDPKKILGTISRAKGDGVSLDAYRAESGNSFYPRIVADVWSAYEKLLKKEGAFDFDDLLVKTISLLKNNEDILKRYQETWKYIHIDEYQDTNKVQYELAELLSSGYGNICVVGDIDQNIYSWRGADIDNLIAFEDRHRNTKVILLEENYRSTQTIVAVSNEIIKKNRKRKEKTLYTKNPEGEKLSLYVAMNEEDEARHVAVEIKELMKNKTPPQEIAVLYRANFQSRVLEDVLLQENIPYKLLGTRFFERKEVKDVLSFLRAALVPENSMNLSRIMNVPPRGIGKVTLLKVLAGKRGELPASTKKKVDEFFFVLEKIKETALKEKPSKTIQHIVKNTGLETHLKNSGDEGVERLENIQELSTLAARYDHLPPEEGVELLLADAALASEQDEMDRNKHEAVTLMTVHAAKGLEFDFVFVTGLEEGLFPHERNPDDSVDEEEERRLFYVALTRARKKIFLSYASVRTIFGSRQWNIPSEFITDIDDEWIDVKDGSMTPLKTIYLE